MATSKNEKPRTPWIWTAKGRKTLAEWRVYFTLCSLAMRKRVSQLCI